MKPSESRWIYFIIIMLSAAWLALFITPGSNLTPWTDRSPALARRSSSCVLGSVCLLYSQLSSGGEKAVRCRGWALRWKWESLGWAFSVPVAWVVLLDPEPRPVCTWADGLWGLYIFFWLLTFRYLRKEVRWIFQEERVLLSVKVTWAQGLGVSL